MRELVGRLPRAIAVAWRRARGSLRSSAFERQLADELRCHIELEADALVARGLDRSRAIAEARRRFGSVAQVADECRDSWGFRALDAAGQDLRYALRMLARSPVRAATVVITLALGIGATTAVFSVVHAVLLRSLPYAAGDRLVEIRQQTPGIGAHDMGLSAREMDDYRAQASTLAAVVEYHQMWFTLLGRDGTAATRVSAGVVSPQFFDVLGVTPALGRTLRDDDDRPDAPAAVMVSHAYWLRALGGDRRAVGRAFQMNDRVYTVVGVLPAVPMYPEENDVYMPPSACPFRSAPGMAADRRMRMTSAIGRMKPGASLAATRTELALIARRLAATYPDAYNVKAGFTTTAVSVRDELTARARPLLWLLLGAATFVLLLVCANAANLMMATLADRGRELALRWALGAAHSRIVRQLTTETMLLAVAGGVGGVAIAALTTSALVSFVAQFTPRAAEVTIDRAVLLFALGLSIGTGCGVSCAGAMSARARTVKPRRPRLRHVLVAAQVALAFVLLIGAGLFVRSFMRLQSVDAGFDANHVLTALISLDWTKYASDDDKREYYRALLDRLSHERGVDAAALSLTFPLNASTPSTASMMIDRRRPDARRLSVDFRLASPDYFRVLGMSLLSGRSFGASDHAKARPVAIVNLSTAKHFFGGSDPVGYRVSFDNGRTWRRIVGVVSDVRQYGLATEPSNEVYLPFDQRAPLSATLLVRTPGDPAALWSTIQRAGSAVDRNQPISRPQTLAQVRRASLALPKATATLVALFGVVALIVTAAGVAGVAAGAVSQRTTEIAVRRALGARRWSVVGLVAGQSFAAVAMGIGVGAASALIASRAVVHLLFATTPTDPTTYAGVAAGLVGVAAVACAAPARRAASIEPAVSLRSD